MCKTVQKEKEEAVNTEDSKRKQLAYIVIKRARCKLIADI